MYVLLYTFHHCIHGAADGEAQMCVTVTSTELCVVGRCIGARHMNPVPLPIGMLIPIADCIYRKYRDSLRGCRAFVIECRALKT